MYIAALSTIVKVWKEPKCPLMDEWRKKISFALLVGIQAGAANLENRKIKIELKIEKIKNTRNNGVGKDVEKKELPCTVYGNANLYSHYGKQYGGCSKN